MVGIYNSLYTLLASVLFGGTVVGFQELFLVVICGSACLLAVALPFLLVWKVCRMIMGG